MNHRIRVDIRLLPLLAMQVCWVSSAAAQMPMPPSTQFDVTGFLQDASVTTPGSPLSGGKLTVNGQEVIVPANTIVILPANALTWEELFAQAPAVYKVNNQTGLALSDFPAPLASYEVHVVGNRVVGATDQYIAGLINITQQGLNSGSGYINFIDYANGELRVGGKMVYDASGVPLNVLDGAQPGARVRINDPGGRFGRVNSPDPRFTVDPENPTIISATGFPMCLPRADPAASPDLLCSEGNRPKDALGNFLPAFTMQDPAAIDAPGGSPLDDPRIQAPLELGDYVTFAGTLVTDLTDPGPTAGPYPGTIGTYVSAHTIVDNIAIYTAPGTNPAYVMIEVSLIGTGGLTVVGAGEAAARTRFEGMTTDATRSINLYGIDYDPSGTSADRYWGTIAVDQGPPTGAVKGRWRFRPPCLPFGSVPTKPDKECVMNQSGTFLPPPRELRAVIAGLETQIPGLASAATAANGIFYGQYHAPIGEYIFPENIPGAPIVENNFNTIPFLAQGGYSSSTGVVAPSRLDPWPSNIIPAGSCQAPTANAGGPYTVASTGTVNLTGTVTGAPGTVSWTQTGAIQGTFGNTASASTTFTAPPVAAQQVVNLTLSVTNACGSASSDTTVTINAAVAPTVAHIAPQTVTSGRSVTLTTSATDPGGLPVTFQWQQIVSPGVLVPAGTSVFQNNPTTGPTVNSGQAASSPSFVVTLAPGTLSTTLQFEIWATNSANVSSAHEFTSVTINPIADNVTVTAAEYRIGKRRLSLTATSNVVSPNVALTLQPYVTTTGTTYSPCPADGGLGCVFTNAGGGLYTLDLVGVPEPAVPPATPLVVRSNLGGASPGTALTRIRN